MANITTELNQIHSEEKGDNVRAAIISASSKIADEFGVDIATELSVIEEGTKGSIIKEAIHQALYRLATEKMATYEHGASIFGTKAHYALPAPVLNYIHGSDQMAPPHTPSMTVEIPEFLIPAGTTMTGVLNGMWEYTVTCTEETVACFVTTDSWGSRYTGPVFMSTDASSVAYTMGGQGPFAYGQTVTLDGITVYVSAQANWMQGTYETVSGIPRYSTIISYMDWATGAGPSSILSYCGAHAYST